MVKNLATPYQTKKLLKLYGLSLKKSLGQNFLIDANILRHLVAPLNLTADTGVVEIGPGMGALTEALANSAGKVVAIEVDGRLIPILQDIFANLANVHVIHADILKVDLRQLLTAEFRPGQDMVVAANLPYYITTPILLKLLQQSLPFRTIVVMVQKEVARRMTAVPNQKAYGSLSIAIQYNAHAKKVMDVPKTAFLPNPHVDSTVLRLEKRLKPAAAVKDEGFFFEVVRASFRQRRKTIFNNLVSFFLNIRKEQLQYQLKAAGISPMRRAETLSIEDFARLSERLSMFTDE